MNCSVSIFIRVVVETILDYKKGKISLKIYVPNNNYFYIYEIFKKFIFLNEVSRQFVIILYRLRSESFYVSMYLSLLPYNKNIFENTIPP